MPPYFPGVTPFCIPSPHHIAIYPSNYTVALAVGVQPLYTCLKAILDLPSEDIPLGSIRYCFREGIREVFTPLNSLIEEAYTHTLGTLEVHDFLDGRVVTKYSYLVFWNKQIHTICQGYTFEDVARAHPQLLNFCFSPRIPADPFDYLLSHPDNKPCTYQ